MKYIYVLEDDRKLQKQIFDALRKSEPQAQIRFFDSLEKFQKWIVVCVKSGKEALFQGGEKLPTDPEPLTTAMDASDELILFVSKDEFLGSHYMSLIRKTQAMFIQKGICTVEDPTRLVITAFESPAFDIKLVEDRIISNVIFKPFDELILQQHLHFAIKGHHPASESFVYKVQTTHEVEMSKEVQMEAVGDVGFVTVSPREIKVGQISKYYGDVFRSTGRTHVMGICTACIPHPQFPSEFQVWFSYFGIPSRQISDIRKNIAALKAPTFASKNPLKTDGPGTRWIVLDPQKDRAQKYKSVLEKHFQANVKIISGFDQFFHQCDPVALENARKEKPWLDTPSIKLQLNSHGDKILKIFPEDQATKKIFGELFSEFQKHSFIERLHEESQIVWKSWMHNGLPDQHFLIVQNASTYFTLKATHFAKNAEGFELELTEPSTLEKTHWYQTHFPTPHSAFGIMVAEEYLHDERLPFWGEFVAGSQTRGKVPWLMGVCKQVPDEKHSRLLKSFWDMFEASNDEPYIERKLKWLNGEMPGDNSSPFLVTCEDVIRVANPVEIAELSEAGLVINYYRPMDLGVFRKFVLAKTGQDTYSEYLANCNYSCPHPTEKELFQNHFVFFGITDLYLKSIRVWILDNYVHSKQSESA